MVSAANRSACILIGLVVLAKLGLSNVFPIIGDEAYFIQWGRHVAGGYYDHPPLAGWWLHAVLWFSDHQVAIRLMAVFVSLLPALIVIQRIKPDPQRFLPVLVVCLCLPVLLINIFFTTDTLMIGLGILAMLSYVHATEVNRSWAFILTGLFLGGSFLSKYFAVLIGISILADQVVRSRSPFRNLALILVGVSPFIAWNLWWNIQHCGYNLLFNIVNRQVESASTLWNIPLYLGTLVLVIPPWIMMSIVRGWNCASVEDRVRLAPWVTLVMTPVVLFFLVSFWKPVGLHWLIFICFPALMLWAGVVQTARIRRDAMLTGAWGLSLLLILAVFALAPLERLFNSDKAGRVDWYRYGEQVALAMLTTFDENSKFAVPSYSRAASLSYYLGQDVLVIGEGSRYGRNGDLYQKFDNLEGKRIVVVGTGREELRAFEPFFIYSKISEIEVRPQFSVWTLEGINFDYQSYRAHVEAKIINRFYQIPSWLPVMNCAYTDDRQDLRGQVNE